MVALAQSVLADRVEQSLPRLQEALEAENKLEVDRLVAFISSNQLITIDFLVYLRWRGIVRDQYIGDLAKDVVNTLS